MNLYAQSIKRPNGIWNKYAADAFIIRETTCNQQHLHFNFCNPCFTVILYLLPHGGHLYFLSNLFPH